MVKLRKTFYSIFLAVVLALCPAQAVFAESVGPGGAQNGSTDSQTYGPVTYSQQEYGTYGPGSSGPAQGTLLQANDPVPLWRDETVGLGGGRIIMVKGTQTEHQLCLIAESPEGHRVVIDGGRDVNTDYLYRYLCENGGYVDAWLVTHPHHDHVGALMTILNNPAQYPLEIRAIYAATSVREFLRTWDGASRIPFMDGFFDALDRFDQSKLHRDPAAGTIVNFGSMEVKILNAPYLIVLKDSAGNNSSVVYRITMGGKRLLVLGDLSYEGSLRLLTEQPADQLRSEIVQLAHHGQHAGCPELYGAILPQIALWPSSAEIWAKTGALAVNPQESYTPAVTMSWMTMLGVKKNYSMSEGNWLLR